MNDECISVLMSRQLFPPMINNKDNYKLQCLVQGSWIETLRKFGPVRYIRVERKWTMLVVSDITMMFIPGFDKSDG